MNRIYLVLLSVLLLGSSVDAFAQHLFRFGDAKLKDGIKKGAPLTVHYRARKSVPEMVPGLAGKGLRTDGYSTSVSIGLSPGFSHAPSVAGYFALETFPTDTAGFFSVSNKAGDEWISACIDRFGTPMIGIGADGKTNYFAAEKRLSRFRWLHIALNVLETKAQLWVNGKLVKETPIAKPAYLIRDTVFIGRSNNAKTINIFPVNRINGIIDEVTISPAPFASGAIVKAQVKEMSTAPSLAVSSERFRGDFNRPKYHLLPAANWTNETHGLFLHNGIYHIFNQKNGNNLFLGQINWGHFTSKDLVTWTEQIPAITPDKDYDQNGIWSGHAVKDKDGKPVLIYTGGGKDAFTIGLAYPADSSLLNWEKYSGNPVVSSSPAGFERKDLHDPYVWREGENWYMIIGFGEVEGKKLKGLLLLYKSPDLKKWQYLHPLFTGDPDKDDSGVFWEMPVFWKMNGKYILLVNKVPHNRRPAVALYWTGDFKNEKFVPDNPVPKRLEIINRLLSPSVNLDADRRTTAIAIIPDETSAKATELAGWTHLFSIPRVWELKNDSIYQSPHPALEKLRGKLDQPKGRRIAAGETLQLSAKKHQLEINVDLTPETARRFGFIVGKNADGTEFSKIYFDLDNNQLVVDQSKSTKRKFYPLQIRKGDYTATPGKKINLHLFIDGSVIEGFIDNKDAFTTRLFPMDEASSIVELFAEEGSLKVDDIKVWELKSSLNQTNLTLSPSGKP
ncbi:GH32 C-terminal domain-containing protein [Mucilaginibacter aquariorum]|uniref:beta-fructofuranosidase n=1 Tax=Mucilaginibacter aquariorum TaxID=2967225 RepID=A0ABT1T7Y4_9SPHI|nr:GH32 C-terminal domain-containing protein [Mucilaginibacter aquariorum]MCQ6960749.1 GH32 C-terminal domain-containing protein [Mucilaginibacter aquariorum]